MSPNPADHTLSPFFLSVGTDKAFLSNGLCSASTYFSRSYHYRNRNLLADVPSHLLQTHQMAAPFFTHPNVLQADLKTLGYPDVNQNSVLSSGKARLATLTWLAQQADPTFEPSTPEHLAAFWDRLGIHSSPPNNAGHRIPFTAPSSRARDRNAANYFLRAAIDLVFAFQARRADDITSCSWSTELDEVHDEETPLSRFDSDNLDQIESLIAQRHILFPNTTRLFQNSTAKKRPLQRRQLNTNKETKPATQTKMQNKPEKNSIPSREHVLNRLRKMQSRANDLESQLNSKPDEKEELSPPYESVGVAECQNSTFALLANDAKTLGSLLEKFACIAVEGLAKRERRVNPAEADQRSKANLSALSKECRALQTEIEHTLDSARGMKAAVADLGRSKHLLEGLPSSAAVQEVLRHKQRTEHQL